MQQATQSRHLILFDGVCGLCNRVVQFLLPRDSQRRFVFASLQSATGRRWLAHAGMRADVLESVVVVKDYESGKPEVLAESRAALFVAGQLGWPWRAATVLGVLPAALLNIGYRAIARSRYRVFGRYDACPLPTPEERARFIDM